LFLHGLWIGKIAWPHLGNKPALPHHMNPLRNAGYELKILLDQQYREIVSNRKLV
jgi:hypothetical protein